MKKNILILIVLFFISLKFSCCSKPKSTENFNRSDFFAFKKKHKIDEIQSGEILKSSNISLSDSIKTEVDIFSSKIIIRNFFIKSKTNLTVNFYEENGKLILISIKQESEKYDLTDKYLNFIIDNNLVKNSYTFYGVQLGISYDLFNDYEKQIRINKNLTNSFLSNFALEQYLIVKGQSEDLNK